MGREWDDRRAGKRPIVQQEIESSLYLSYAREDGTGNLRPIANSSSKEHHIRNKKYPFVLPGLGIKPKVCGKPRVWGLGIDGRKVGHIITQCKRIECPDCYVPHWLYPKVEHDAIKLISYMKVTGETFAHFTAEVVNASKVCKSWDISDYEIFHRRTYRHLAGMGVKGGLRGMHPGKIHKDIKTKLAKLGYGTPGKGYWQGVRDNALNLGSVEDYYYLSVHDHIIASPSYTLQHSDNTFIVKKIGELSTPEDIIRALFYIYSHVGVFKDTEDIDNNPIAGFGDFKNFKPEKYLSIGEIKEISALVYEIMHGGKKKAEEEHEEEKVNEDEFIPITVFRIRNDFDADRVDGIISEFPVKNQEFFRDLIRLANEKWDNKCLKSYEKYVFLDELCIPFDIEIVKVVRSKYKNDENEGEKDVLFKFGRRK